jgi:hypothetical protein
MHRFALAFALLALAAGAQAQPKGGPLSPDEALKALKVADGFQVELFAAEPMLINPTTIDVDHKGRVWVAEAVNYRRKNFGRPIIRKEGDRIQVLVDEKGDGKATKAVTFYQGEELYGPLGVCVAPYPDGKGQKVFVCQSPDILVFEDKDGDLKADRRRSSSPGSAGSTTTTGSTASTSARTASSTSPSAIRASRASRAATARARSGSATPRTSRRAPYGGATWTAPTSN